MFSKTSIFSKYIVLLLIVFSLFTRFYKIDWGDGHYFHPDENNMATSVSQLQPHQLNPHFFAYGQFPLYLSYFSLQALHLPLNFSSSILMMRFWSAVFSLVGILVIYLIAQRLFTFPQSLLVVLLSIFTPGLIQMSHFGTTESLLFLVFLIEIYLAIKMFVSPQNNYNYLIAAIALGVGEASKISALIFLTPVLLVTFINFVRRPDRYWLIPKLILMLVLSFIIFLILSPYNLLDYQNFMSTMGYETGVATGQIMVFYTSQFLHTTPYVFQFTHIFPYVFGLPLFIFGLMGLVLLCLNLRKLPSLPQTFWFLILLSCSVYFIYFGQLFTKWTRFMSPLFFLFPFLAAYLIIHLKPRYLKIFTILLCCLPGIYFMNLYFNPDIRVSASSWFEQTIPKNALILSEAGNVVNFPMTTFPYNVTNFDFYNLDHNPTLQQNLTDLLSKTNYLIIPSRRIFKNQNNPDFSVSQSYYHKLFSGSLGFQAIKQFTPVVDLFLNPENAEETWSVFDRPTIRIYHKIQL